MHITVHLSNGLYKDSFQKKYIQLKMKLTLPVCIFVHYFY